MLVYRPCQYYTEPKCVRPARGTHSDHKAKNKALSRAGVMGSGHARIDELSRCLGPKHRKCWIREQADLFEH
jgi:hypothetical protein